jgi:hypothetical protein
LQEKEKSSASEKEMALLVRERNREFDEFNLINTFERNLNKCEQERFNYPGFELNYAR